MWWRSLRPWRSWRSWRQLCISLNSLHFSEFFLCISLHFTFYILRQFDGVYVVLWTPFKKNRIEQNTRGSFSLTENTLLRSFFRCNVFEIASIKSSLILIHIAPKCKYKYSGTLWQTDIVNIDNKGKMADNINNVNSVKGLRSLSLISVINVFYSKWILFQKISF